MELGKLRRELADWAHQFDAAAVTAADCAVLVQHATAIKNLAATIEALAAARVEMARRARDGHTTPTVKDPQRRHERFLALLRVDLPALVRGNVADGETCEIAGYGPNPGPRSTRPGSATLGTSATITMT